jgi:muramoyltetrapeptide carboxypeptidase
MPKVILGYSDVTAFHTAVQRKCRLITFHGPTAREPLTDFSRDSLERAVLNRTDSCGIAPTAREISAGSAEGRLVGGNLSVLSALCGTPYMPDLADGILILEDVNEPAYRIDRMLQQLSLSGALNACKAIVFGDCTNCPEDTGGAEAGARSLDQLLGEIAESLGVPCLAGVPIGHIAQQWTIPLGAMARVDTADRSLTVTAYTS